MQDQDQICPLFFTHRSNQFTLHLPDKIASEISPAVSKLRAIFTIQNSNIRRYFWKSNIKIDCHCHPPAARQHPSYGDCLEVKREYYQNCSGTGLCDTMFTVSSTHMSSSYRFGRLGLSHWDSYAMHRGGCLELYYCNMVEWSWWDSALSERPTFFLQCFDTVGLVIWPVKIVPEMTYNLSSGTLSLYTTTTVTVMDAIILARK